MPSELHPVLSALADELAASASRQYRIGVERARTTIEELWTQDIPLQQAAAHESHCARFKRTRAYKRASKAAKKRIYYELRRYRADDEILAQVTSELRGLPHDVTSSQIAELVLPALKTHVSTAERLPHVDQFLEELLEAIGAAETVVDIGCGMVPLLFPFDGEGHSVRRYCAADKDDSAIALVDAYAKWRGDGRLYTCRWELAQGWTPLTEGIDGASFDVGLLLKLVPVVRRQQSRLLPVLGAVPARRIVVTGSREAMVKRRSIAARELRTIEDFGDSHGLRMVRRFQTPDEVGLVFDRPI